jgi:hypothetical protein
VLGSEPEILFYARRRSATGYLYTYGLMEIAEIEDAAPAFVVLVDVSTSWLATPRSGRHLLAWSGEYPAANYDVVGAVAILGPERTEYVWGDAAADAPVADLVVFRRKGFGSP